MGARNSHSLKVVTFFSCHDCACQSRPCDGTPLQRPTLRSDTERDSSVEILENQGAY